MAAAGRPVSVCVQIADQRADFRVRATCENRRVDCEDFVLRYTDGSCAEPYGLSAKSFADVFVEGRATLSAKD
jgi:hypothetical protein